MEIFCFKNITCIDCKDDCIFSKTKCGDCEYDFYSGRDCYDCDVCADEQAYYLPDLEKVIKR